MLEVMRHGVIRQILIPLIFITAVSHHGIMVTDMVMAGITTGVTIVIILHFLILSTALGVEDTGEDQLLMADGVTDLTGILAGAMAHTVVTDGVMVTVAIPDFMEDIHTTETATTITT